MIFVGKYFLVAVLFFCTYAQAQLLPDNTSLNVQAVQRWMQSNRDFANVVQVLEPMHKSEDDLKKFEALPADEQDRQITAFLQKNNLVGVTREIALRHGWKSVGEYLRFSTKLGNAIAAYFFAQELEGLTDQQKKTLRAKTDAAVLNTPKEDIAFIKAHEALLKNYIQAYSKGR